MRGTQHIYKNQNQTGAYYEDKGTGVEHLPHFSTFVKTDHSSLEIGKGTLLTKQWLGLELRVDFGTRK